MNDQITPLAYFIYHLSTLAVKNRFESDLKRYY